MNSLPRALFVSHGGGPLPLLDDPAHREMVACLEGIAAHIPRPDAVLVVSAHWEEPVPTITAGSRPPLIYDYYGFPPESYAIQYPCAGEPSLAHAVQHRLGNLGIEARLDPSRGLDHGVFVPLRIMYPDATIPCVQLSLADTLDARFHVQMGQALQGLSQQNVLIIGSGFSFHNMGAFFAPPDAQSSELNASFETWLHAVCADPALSECERQEALIHWTDAPGARYCHPREEHLMPLHVCYGASEGACVEHYPLTIMNRRASMYRW